MLDSRHSQPTPSSSHPPSSCNSHFSIKPRSATHSRQHSSSYSTTGGLVDGVGPLPSSASASANQPPASKHTSLGGGLFKHWRASHTQSKGKDADADDLEWRCKGEDFDHYTWPMEGQDSEGNGVRGEPDAQRQQSYAPGMAHSGFHKSASAMDLRPSLDSNHSRTPRTPGMTHSRGTSTSSTGSWLDRDRDEKPLPLPPMPANFSSSSNAMRRTHSRSKSHSHTQSHSSSTSQLPTPELLTWSPKLAQLRPSASSSQLPSLGALTGSGPYSGMLPSASQDVHVTPKAETIVTSTGTIKRRPPPSLDLASLRAHSAAPGHELSPTSSILAAPYTAPVTPGKSWPSENDRERASSVPLDLNPIRTNAPRSSKLNDDDDDSPVDPRYVHGQASTTPIKVKVANRRSRQAEEEKAAIDAIDTYLKRVSHRPLGASGEFGRGGRTASGSTTSLASTYTHSSSVGTLSTMSPRTSYTSVSERSRPPSGDVGLNSDSQGSEGVTMGKGAERKGRARSHSHSYSRRSQMSNSSSTSANGRGSGGHVRSQSNLNLSTSASSSSTNLPLKGILNTPGRRSYNDGGTAQQDSEISPSTTNQASPDYAYALNTPRTASAASTPLTAPHSSNPSRHSRSGARHSKRPSAPSVPAQSFEQAGLGLTGNSNLDTSLFANVQNGPEYETGVVEAERKLSMSSANSHGDETSMDSFALTAGKFDFPEPPTARPVWNGQMGAMQAQNQTQVETKASGRRSRAWTTSASNPSNSVPAPSSTALPTPSHRRTKSRPSSERPPMPFVPGLPQYQHQQGSGSRLASHAQHVSMLVAPSAQVAGTKDPRAWASQPTTPADEVAGADYFAAHQPPPPPQPQPFRIRSASGAKQTASTTADGTPHALPMAAFEPNVGPGNEIETGVKLRGQRPRSQSNAAGLRRMEPAMVVGVHAPAGARGMGGEPMGRRRSAHFSKKDVELLRKEAEKEGARMDYGWI